MYTKDFCIAQLLFNVLLLHPPTHTHIYIYIYIYNYIYILNYILSL